MVSKIHADKCRLQNEWCLVALLFWVAWGIGPMEHFYLGFLGRSLKQWKVSYLVRYPLPFTRILWSVFVIMWMHICNFKWHIWSALMQYWYCRNLMSLITNSDLLWFYLWVEMKVMKNLFVCISVCIIILYLCAKWIYHAPLTASPSSCLLICLPEDLC